MKIEETSRITCNFVYNDYDVLFPNGKNTCIVIGENGSKYHVPVHFNAEDAHVGIWLERIVPKQFEQCCRFIFNNYAFVKRIQFKNYPVQPSGRKNVFSTNNHWSINLPDSENELDERLSSKKRYNIKREKRLAKERIGEYEIVEYKTENVPEYIITSYFEYKKVTYGIDYAMSARDYLKTYHVTNIYAMMFGNEVGAIVCSCEQKENVYLENLTYKPEYSKYSLGAILYDEYLKILIRKRKKSLYLGYGHQQYKALYGAVETTVFTGTVYRTVMLYIREVKIPMVYSKLRSMLRKFDIFNLRKIAREILRK